MKKQIPSLLIFIFIFIGINIVSIKTSNFYNQKRDYTNYIEKAFKSKPNIIILGDSHIGSIKQLQLDYKISNLAYGADGIKEMYVKTKILLENDNKLKCAIISTEPQIFNKSNSPNSGFLNKYLSQKTNTLSVYNKNRLDLLIDKIPLFNLSLIHI